MTINLKNVSIASAIVAVFVVALFFVVPQFSDIKLNFGAATAEACCGGDGGDSGGDGGGGTPCEIRGECGPVVPPPPAAAKCEFLKASHTSVPAKGANVTLSWGTKSATTVSISGIGSVVADGSKSVFVNSATTFTLTAKSSGGSDTCSVKITVEKPPAVPAKCVSLTASRTTVPAGGANVTLTWDTDKATSATLSSVGSVSVDGTRTVFVDTNRTYTLTAVGAGGNDTCTVTIKVAAVKPAAQCLFLDASKTVVDEDGENVTLSWDTKNATSVSINGIGTVSGSGSRTVFVNSNRTYTLTAVGAGGNDTCAVTIHVEDEQPAPRCDYFRASDNNVEEGDRVTLSWATTNADRVTISPDIGNVSDDGSTTVTVDNDTTYTLRARNLDNGQEDSCTVTIRAEEEEREDRKTPRCDLEISDDRVKRGERVTLSWETTHVDDIRIRDDRGNTVFDTDNYSRSDRKRYFDGSVDLIINQSTEFTMTAGGVDGGSKTCRVDVDVEDIAIYVKHDQTPVISLTQVPYTGFEAGTFLTFLFYALLTLWALFVAYVMVIKKSSVFGFSLYQKGPHISESDMEDRKKVEALVAKYAGTSWK